MIPVPDPVLDALAQLYGTKAASLSHFGGGREDSDGIVYAYPYQDRRRLLKIMAIPAETQRRGLFCLEERLRFTRFLGEHGARIVFPELSPGENLYERFPCESFVWVGYSMEIAPGRTPEEKTRDADLFRNWGETVGKLHHLAREYPAWQASVDPISGEKHLTWQEEWQGFYEWSQDEEVKQKWIEIRGKLEALPVSREIFGFIHNDPHLWNLLAEGDRITLLDFDVANHHWFINDISIACQSILFGQSGGMDRPVCDREKLLGFLKRFMEGYRRQYDLPSEWLDHLDLFIAYRRILLFTVMQGWIGSKPEWKQSWKRMILTEPVVGGVLSAQI